jgi:hypothetical protein
LGRENVYINTCDEFSIPVGEVPSSFLQAFDASEAGKTFEFRTIGGTVVSRDVAVSLIGTNDANEKLIKPAVRDALTKRFTKVMVNKEVEAKHNERAQFGKCIRNCDKCVAEFNLAKTGLTPKDLYIFHLQQLLNPPHIKQRHVMDAGRIRTVDIVNFECYCGDVRD